MLQKGAYNFDFGGIYLADNGYKTTTRGSILGVADTFDSSSFTGQTDIFGNLQAYNYGTRAFIGGTSFSLVQANLAPNGDFSLMGTGEAEVNGVPTNIGFAAQRNGTALVFMIFHGDTGTVLAGGMGEPNLAALQLTLSS
jgi:hypothetical protein